MLSSPSHCEILLYFSLRFASALEVPQNLMVLPHLERRAQADASQRFQGSVAATPDGFAEQFGHYGREGLAKVSGPSQFQRKSVDQAAR